MHKDVFPVDYMEVLGVFIIIFGTAFANAVGLGGGVILVPSLLIFYYFSPHDAFPLTQALIFGGVVSAVFVALRMKHPFYPAVDKPIISFQTAMILQPSMLLGAKFGVILNPIFPG